ncbi:hypothetical protein B0J15DRAFT_525270 [Fusarium solani]|uniref:Uncharacterized protein n=1 Tax=Fusarium solani TaxID=169388 RepID=A0A9P9KNB6_FUSSL|nr:uncharacterized protein B0J15DRAFT_525270 [Fusarium solani]KAH7260489.1 hypothetical protein B0J15DRAFT_525270 [Fusarium solani]
MEKLREEPAGLESTALAPGSSRPKASIPALCEPQHQVCSIFRELQARENCRQGMYTVPMDPWREEPGRLGYESTNAGANPEMTGKFKLEKPPSSSFPETASGVWSTNTGIANGFEGQLPGLRVHAWAPGTRRNHRWQSWASTFQGSRSTLRQTAEQVVMETAGSGYLPDAGGRKDWSDTPLICRGEPCQPFQCQYPSDNIRGWKEGEAQRSQICRRLGSISVARTAQD